MKGISINGKKSLIYIGAFSLALIVLIVFAISINSDSKKNNNTNNSAVASAVQNNVNNNAPMVTRGDDKAIVDADLKVPARDIDFSMSIDSVKEYEATLDDSTGEASVAQGTDGFKYVTFQSNPDNPIKVYNIPFSNTSPGLSYVFQNDSFLEVRYQFGFIDETSTNALVAGFKADYGEATFYREFSDSKTWWWKSDSIWLMISKDSAGTTIFYRKL